ncbi:hypothetical protein [uncultured Hymenobacter sp.]|uniref:hypothetical protein n=1 Tax=uncultured Hymenobacter sp. TaxID=170016 RepID=UPI0035C9910B
MKHLSASFSKLLAVMACALTLGSCNRAEYAVLPKTSSPYHGVARVRTPVPVEREIVAAPVATPVVTPTSPATPQAESVLAPATAQAVAASSATVVATTVADPATVVTPTPSRKLNPVQRLAVAKITRKLEKASQKAASGRHDNTASTQRLDSKLRQGLILLLIGILIGILAGAIGGTLGTLIGVLGLIIGIVGVAVIVLYLLDSL